LSTAFHPQTDGQTEQVNQEVEQYLRLFISHCQEDSPEWIAIAEFAYNNKVHSAMQVSPFFANYGFNPCMGVEPHWTSKVEAVEDFAECMKHIHEEAQVALSKAQDEIKCYADQHWGDVPEYQVSQKVWVETNNIDLKWPSKKLLRSELALMRSWRSFHPMQLS